MKKETKKFVLLNIFIYLALLLLPPSLFYVYKSIKLASVAKAPEKNLNINPAYPTKEDQLHAEQLANDLSNIKPGLEYVSFLGWRRFPYKANYHNVLSRYRNRYSINSNPVNSTWFFGGSTMWGTGASDQETIPSWYASKKSTDVFNLGETAWTSRQSLNQLLNLIGDHNYPSRVVFYDGVNDTIHGCRSELENVPAHTFEPAIKEGLKPFSSQALTELSKQYIKIRDFIAAPYKAVGGKLGIYKASHRSLGSLDCSSNPAKANRIANHLINNWYSAYLISKANNADFMAILQPHSFVTKDMDLSYLNRGEQYLKLEHEAVYKSVLDEMTNRCKVAQYKDFCTKFVDATTWLDGSPPVYIDFAHLTGRGNQVIANKIIEAEK